MPKIEIKENRTKQIIHRNGKEAMKNLMREFNDSASVLKSLSRKA